MDKAEFFVRRSLTLGLNDLEEVRTGYVMMLL